MSHLYVIRDENERHILIIVIVIRITVAGSVPRFSEKQLIENDFKILLYLEIIQLNEANQLTTSSN
jgi:hypothetical protein